jgi:hypothetical protein
VVTQVSEVRRSDKVGRRLPALAVAAVLAEVVGLLQGWAGVIAVAVPVLSWVALLAWVFARRAGEERPLREVAPAMVIAYWVLWAVGFVVTSLTKSLVIGVGCDAVQALVVVALVRSSRRAAGAAPRAGGAAFTGTVGQWVGWTIAGTLGVLFIDLAIANPASHIFLGAGGAVLLGVVYRSVRRAVAGQ